MITTKRKAREEALKAGFRSKFEFMFSQKLKALKLKATYETGKLKYIIPQTTKTYTPDWEIAPDVYIETKGLFSATDRKKILYVKEHNPTIKIYLLFQNAKVTLSRKSKTTYADWCDKNGIEWADIKEERIWKAWFKK